MYNNSLHNSHRYHLHLLQFNLHLLSALDLYFQSQYLLLLILFLTKLIITIRQRLFLIETYDVQNEIGLKTSIHMVVKVDSLLLLDLKIMNPFFKRSNGIRYTMNCCHRTMPLSRRLSINTLTPLLMFTKSYMQCYCLLKQTNVTILRIIKQ